ncbi:hypothetical protein XENOCAPTIV_009298, partial [Xenoophorus captivus]
IGVKRKLGLKEVKAVIEARRSRADDVQMKLHCRQETRACSHYNRSFNLNSEYIQDWDVNAYALTCFKAKSFRERYKAQVLGFSAQDLSGQ